MPPSVVTVDDCELAESSYDPLRNLARFARLVESPPTVAYTCACTKSNCAASASICEPDTEMHRNDCA